MRHHATRSRNAAFQKHDGHFIAAGCEVFLQACETLHDGSVHHECAVWIGKKPHAPHADVEHRVSVVTALERHQPAPPRLSVDLASRLIPSHSLLYPSGKPVYFRG